MLLVSSFVLVLVFILVRAVPGDPAVAALGSRGTPETIQALRHQLGIDRPLPSQFLAFLTSLGHGDLGSSLAQQGRPVSQIVLPALGVTTCVVLLAVAISLMIGVPWGLYAALSRGGRIDALSRGAAVALLASPPFWIGLLLILVLAVRTGWLPAGGWGAAWPDHLRYLWLPSLALSAYLTPMLMRVVRQAAADVSQTPFVEAAIARGIPARTVTFRHILPNSLLPVITLIFLNVGVLISGTVVIEAVFALPGLGTTLNNAINQLDYPVVQAAAIISALIVVAANLMGDALNALVDPRISRDVA